MRKQLPRVLVIGGAGFIGSHTVETLLAEGYPVRVLDDLSSGKLDNLPQHDPALEIRVGDVREAETVDAAMQSVCGCIHLAAQVSAPRSVNEPLASATRNILGFINVIEAARAHKLPRVVYASSAAVYGDNQNLPLAEEEMPQPNNPYGLEKQVDELYAGLYRRLHGLRCLGLRYFNVYGPRQDPASPYSGVISRFIERLSAGTAPVVYGDGRQTRDFVHVKDVARINVLALASDHCGVCNVASGSSVDLLRLVEVLGDCLGRSVAPRFEPERAGDIRHSRGSGERLRQYLGFTPALSLEEGLNQLAQGLGRGPQRARRTNAQSAV